MKRLKIEAYSSEDNFQALELEKHCIQGRSFALSFIRPTFHARSQVYDNYKIFCAKLDEKLIGVFAAAEKKVTLNNEPVRALYFYDCRIHPEYRHNGIAKRLTETLVESFGKEIKCYYTLIAGQNERAFQLACKGFGAKVVIPLTYLIFPVYKKYNFNSYVKTTTAQEIFNNFISNQNKQFIPDSNLNNLTGYVNSWLQNDYEAGCSVWTNENLLSERIEKIPFRFNIYKKLSGALIPFVALPQIPGKKEILQSWFLFNFYCTGIQSAENLLKHINNQALQKGKKFIYVLLQNDDPLLSILKKIRLRRFELPYSFLVKGDKMPAKSANIYIDIKDL
jgi:Acetyltransferase (GNAT) family